jgi:hypothetical protein
MSEVTYRNETQAIYDSLCMVLVYINIVAAHTDENHEM